MAEEEPTEFPVAGKHTSPGGYDREWFVDGEHKRFQVLCCVVCDEVAKLGCRTVMPGDNTVGLALTVRRDSCVHLCCWECITRWTKSQYQDRPPHLRNVSLYNFLTSCPQCRLPLSLPAVKLDMTQLALLEIEMVYCKNKSYGCEWTGLFGLHGAGMLEHLTTDCRCHPVECKYRPRDCPRTNQVAQTLHEEKDCPGRPATCPHCSWTTDEAEKLQSHWEDDCVVPVACPRKCWEWAVGKSRAPIPPHVPLPPAYARPGANKNKRNAFPSLPPGAKKPKVEVLPLLEPTRLFLSPSTATVALQTTPSHPVELLPAYPRNEWRRHDKTCPLLRVSCPYKGIGKGCVFQSLPHEMATHLKVEWEAHAKCIGGS